MRFRKFALRGIIILAVVIALCVLFSGTIRSLTTPKVRFAPVKQGKFESVTELSGKVVFPEVEEIVLNVPEDATLTVSKVMAAAGKKVKKGEALMNAGVTDLDKKLASLRQEYDSAQNTLDAWDRKNGELRLTRSEQLWMETYEAAREAEQTEREARLTLLTVLKADTVPEALPEGAGAETEEVFAAWQKAADDLAASRQKLREMDRYAIPEDTWTLLQNRQEAERKRADAESRMMTLMRLGRESETVVAPHAGYITEVSVEKGGVLSGETVVMKITAEKQDPVIRADVSEIKQPIKKGTTLIVPSDPWGSAETKVVGTGVTISGHPFVDAEISQDVIYTLGPIEEMMKEDNIVLRLSLKAQDSTCLVPAAAVRGGGDGRFVYVGEQHQSAFEGNTIRVQKMTVTVLAESASTVSIAEDLSYTKVLYMEDRSIEEGVNVMLYEE